MSLIHKLNLSQLLTGIVACWRDDKPDGICISLSYEPDPETTKRIAASFDKMLAGFRADPDQAGAVKELWAQLKHYCAHKEEATPLKDGLTIVTVIYLLENAGHIKADEFNGVTFIYQLS